MSVTPALLVAWYSRVVQRLQGVIDTRPKQYLATLALPIAFLLAVVVIYRAGKPLKRRFTPELVEITRTLTIMIVALVDAVLFVIIWRHFDETAAQLDDFWARIVPGAQTAMNIYITFITLLGTYMLTRVTKRVIRYWSENGRISPHQRELAHHLVMLSLFLIVSAFIFGLFGLDPAQLFLGAGVLGVVLGLAARKTLGNVLSGLVILFGRPFEAGDWITVGDREGIVTDISVFNTQVRTFNEEHLLIPNDVITDTEVINYSKTNRLRLTTEVGIDYDDDVSTAAAIAKRSMESCDAVADTPNPDVVLDSFGDSAVVLRLRYWIDRPTIQQKLSAQNEVIEAVKSAFEAEDIKIPFPQRELMGRAETDGFEIAGPGEVAGHTELEGAVRRVREDTPGDPTAVREPVQAEYGGDGEPDADGGTEHGEAGDDGPAAAASDDASPDGDDALGEPVEEPVEAEYGGDPDADRGGESAGQPGYEGTPDDAGDGHPLESAAQLVEDGEADVSSPHPRTPDSAVYPATEDDTVTEPVEDEHGRRRRTGTDDAGGDEQPAPDGADADASAASEADTGAHSEDRETATHEDDDDTHPDRTRADVAEDDDGGGDDGGSPG